MNLLEETIDVLKKEWKKEDDVLWCGSEDFWFTWEEFKKVADTIYDKGYGAPKVATDLVVVGKDFWLERHEYDGAEWWELKTTPKKPEIHKKPVALTINQADELGFDISCGWESLKKINGE